MVYRRKKYYSDDELFWGVNSDIDDEDSFPYQSGFSLVVK